jgi:glycerophosphoryl diester phosphodiesterase
MLINLGLSFLLRNLPTSVFAMVPIKFRGINILTNRFRKFCENRGIDIHIWTINDPAIAQDLKSAGASGIVTDDYFAFLPA